VGHLIPVPNRTNPLSPRPTLARSHIFKKQKPKCFLACPVFPVVFVSTSCLVDYAMTTRGAALGGRPLPYYALGGLAGNVPEPLILFLVETGTRTMPWGPGKPITGFPRICRANRPLSLMSFPPDSQSLMQKIRNEGPRKMGKWYEQERIIMKRHLPAHACMVSIPWAGTGRRLTTQLWSVVITLYHSPRYFALMYLLCTVLR